MTDYPLIPLDQLSPIENPQRDHVVAAMRAGTASAVTIEKILSLAEAVDIAGLSEEISNILTSGSAKAALADDDKFVALDSENSFDPILLTLVDLVTSIFKTSRTIANARFAAATFGLMSAGGKRLSLSTNGLTADRTITPQDRDMTLGIVEGAAQGLNGLSEVIVIIPTGVRRGRIAFEALSTNGTVVPLFQVGTAALWVTSGYGGSGSSITTGTSASLTASGIPLASAVAGASSLNGSVEFVHLFGNKWLLSMGVGNDNVGATQHAWAIVTLPDTLTRVKLTLSSTAFDAGTAYPIWEY